jgi:hypothetical protein
MARIFPTYALDPNSLSDSKMNGGLWHELQTLQSLQSRLSDAYTIFHSTHLAWVENAKVLSREADFLIVNRAGKVLMIEQKGGPLDETPGGLKKSYDGVQKSVPAQCNDIVNRLREKYRETHGQTAKLDIGFLLYCPDYIVRSAGAAGIDTKQIVDARRKFQLSNIIKSFLPEGIADTVTIARVKQCFAQILLVELDLGTQIEASEKHFIRLNEGMTAFFKNLEMKPFNFRLQGIAGCGKTELTSWFVERAVEASKKTLVSCFNRPLADRLSQSLPAGITLDTLHGLALRFLRESGEIIEVGQLTSSPGFWSDLITRAIDRALINVPENWSFDSLVVDEGQDLNQDGFDFLKLLLHDDADIVWMEDQGQKLYDATEFKAEGFVTYRCRQSYRIPKRIARFIAASLAIDFETLNPVPGDPVRIHGLRDPSQLVDALKARLDDLIASGFEPDQIVILTGRGREASKMMQLSTIGPHQLRRQIGFSPAGEAILSPGDVRVETLWRFKGQEAPVVLLCEIDGDLSTESFRRQFYCAVTRPTYRLEIFVPGKGDFYSALLQASSRS